MKNSPDFLHVRGSEIVNGRGEIVRLRGFCLGGWMNSEWMRRTHPVRETKTILRCDYWIERHEAEIERLIQQLTEHTMTVVAGQPGNWTNLGESLAWNICSGVLSRMLLPAFAEQFRGMSENEIDRMMGSFAFENCIQRKGLVQVVSQATARQ